MSYSTTLTPPLGTDPSRSPLNGGEFRWTYLPGSDLKSSLSYPNGLTASWTYDANNQLLRVKNATSTNIISQYDYTYDAAGRRIRIGKSGSAFDFNDVVSYDYNARSELTNAVAAVDANYHCSYQYDAIGNRESSSERGTNTTYAANELNQYSQIAATNEDAFIPEFDDDGNQTLVKTTTGIWSVAYNGENRPVLWTCGTTNIVMSYDRTGRRVTKNDQRFVYSGYLQIVNFTLPSTHRQLFIWDPTEPIATRPLVWNSFTVQNPNVSTSVYTHDGSKNVSEVLAANCVATVHYNYVAFGGVDVRHGESTVVNPWRLSSEYFDEVMGSYYFNYRHYNVGEGRWLTRDANIGNLVLLYGFCKNSPIQNVDYLGMECIDCDTYVEDLEGSIKNGSADSGILSYYKSIERWGCKVDFRCSKDCEPSVLGKAEYKGSFPIFRPKPKIKITLCAGNDNSILDQNPGMVIIHELSHGLDQCIQKSGFSCAGDGTRTSVHKHYYDQKLCTEIRAYAAMGFSSVDQICEQAASSVADTCPYAKGRETKEGFQSALMWRAYELYAKCKDKVY